MPLTTNMIAVGQKEHKEFCFVVKPSPGSRKSDIVGFQQINEMQDMLFVSNQHILVRFNGGKTVTLRSNGAIVHQSARVQDLLDKENAIIVCESQVEFGKKFLVLYDKDDKDIVVLKFGSDGKAEIVGRFNKVKDDIRA